MEKEDISRKQMACILQIHFGFEYRVASLRRCHQTEMGAVSGTWTEMKRNPGTLDRFSFGNNILLTKWSQYSK